MLRLPSADTEIIDAIEYRNVWLRNDPVAVRDAIALETATRENISSGAWPKNLGVVAYHGAEIIGLALSDIRHSERVRANMAYLRVLVAPKHRARELETPLMLKLHEIMRLHSLAHPEAKIGGTMAIVETVGPLEEPVTKAFMLLAGYTPNDQPLVLRWFDHTKL
jgi:hypothetical protein